MTATLRAAVLIPAIPAQPRLSASHKAIVNLTFEISEIADGHAINALCIGWSIGADPPPDNFAPDGGRFEAWADSYRIDRIQPTIRGAVTTSVGPGGHNYTPFNEGDTVYFMLYDPDFDPIVNYANTGPFLVGP